MQAPGAQCNDQGFYQLPTTTKALVLSLPNFTLATAAAFSQQVAEGAAAQTEGLQWVCRSKLQPCMLLDLSTKALVALTFDCKCMTASIACTAVIQSMQPCHCSLHLWCYTLETRWSESQEHLETLTFKELQKSLELTPDRAFFAQFLSVDSKSKTVL